MKLLQPSRVRPKDRVATQTDKTPTAQPVKFPAPVRGWFESQSLAGGGEGMARVIENWFPTTQGVRVRGGCTKVATVGARCRSLFSYTTASTSKLFAATATAVYDVSGFDADTVPSPESGMSGLGGGNWSTEQIGTVGGEYLVAVNGENFLRLFDGTAWASISGVTTPAITGVTTSTLSYVWKHKNRLWFVQKGTKVAWYLPVDSVAGAASDFSLAGVFQKGGSLLFGVTWSQDAGDGMDDRIAFVSTEGEVAVYQGTNPASAADWDLVGLYSMAPPRGMKCHIKAGGDVIVGTDEGAIPLSAIVEKDPAALSTSAVSAAIEASWRKQAAVWDGAQPWEMIKWPRENMLVVSLPHTVDTQFVANLQTGAWAKFIGWDMQCMALFDEQLYFADRSGFIYSAETGGSDNGNSYAARLSYMPSDLDAPAVYKSVGAMRGTFLAIGDPGAQLSLSADYAVTFPNLPQVSSTPGGDGALWDSGVWDVALWDDDGQNSFIVRPVYQTGWVSVGFAGYAMAPQVQLVTSGVGRPSVELVQIDVMLETGGTVV